MQIVEAQPFLKVVSDQDPFNQFSAIVLMDSAARAVDAAARDLIDFAVEQRGTNDPRPGLAFLVSRRVISPEVQEKVRRHGLSRSVIVRVLPLEWLREALGGADTRTLFLIQVRRAIAQDPYDFPDPARLADDFFGLAENVASMVNDARAKAPLLLHGMRSAGKTSFSLQVKDRLDREGWAVPQTITLGDRPSIDWVAAKLVNSSAELVSGELPTWAGGEAPSVELDTFASTVRKHAEQWHKARGATPIFFVIDEADGLIEGARHGREFSRLYDFFRIVRDLVQEDVARFLFVAMLPDLGQVDRFEVAQGGSGNPLFNKCRIVTIPVLGPADARHLLLSLGEKVGVEWDAQTVAWAVEVCGGHPFLLRRLGSSSLRLLRAKSEHDGRITVDILKAAIGEELSGGSCAQYFRSLQERLGEGGSVFLAELESGSQAFQHVKQAFLQSHSRTAWTQVLRTAEALKIAVRSNGQVSVFSELFRIWLQEHA